MLTLADGVSPVRQIVVVPEFGSVGAISPT